MEELIKSNDRLVREVVYLKKEIICLDHELKTYKHLSMIFSIAFAVTFVLLMLK